MAEVQWAYQQNAITLEVSADQMLNEHNGDAHTLLLGIFQVAEADGFQRIAASPVQLSQALNVGLPANSALRTTRYVVHPGTRVTLSIDRAEKAKLVGIIAGYYSMDNRSAKLFEIPLAVEKKGFFTHTYQAQPIPLVLQVTLGPMSIANISRTDAKSSKERSTAQPAIKQPVPLDGGGHEVLLKQVDPPAIQIEN